MKKKQWKINYSKTEFQNRVRIGKKRKRTKQRIKYTRGNWVGKTALWETTWACRLTAKQSCKERNAFHKTQTNSLSRSGYYGGVSTELFENVVQGFG